MFIVVLHQGLQFPAKDVTPWDFLPWLSEINSVAVMLVFMTLWDYLQMLIGFIKFAMMTSLVWGTKFIKIEAASLTGFIFKFVSISCYFSVASQQMHNCLMIDGVLVYISTHLTVPELSTRTLLRWIGVKKSRLQIVEEWKNLFGWWCWIR